MTVVEDFEIKYSSIIRTYKNLEFVLAFLDFDSSKIIALFEVFGVYFYWYYLIFWVACSSQYSLLFLLTCVVVLLILLKGLSYYWLCLVLMFNQLNNNLLEPYWYYRISLISLPRPKGSFTVFVMSLNSFEDEYLTDDWILVFELIFWFINADIFLFKYLKYGLECLLAITRHWILPNFFVD